MNVLRHTADNAAYEAARYAMVPGATAAEAKAKANALLKIIGTRNAVVTVSPATHHADYRQSDCNDRRSDEGQRAGDSQIHWQEIFAQLHRRCGLNARSKAWYQI